ncbi:MAG: DNA polymerase III subunit delta [Betaproteobacteria bacterium]|nr:DNA polymerase III subunit delta [Betaproteobacteria bacterium]
MRVSADQFIARPPKQLAPLYTVHGAEPLLVLEAAETLRALAREHGYVDREVHTVEPGFDWSAMLMAGASLSLFASQRLMEIRIPTGKPGIEGGKALEAFTQKLPDDTVTLVVLPEIDWQGQKAKWFSALALAGTMIEGRAISRAELPAFLAARFKLQNQTAMPDALDFLADQTEGNLLAAVQEVRKLALLAPTGDVSLDTMKDCVLDVSRFHPGQLAEAVHEGDVARLERIVTGLKAEGEPLPLILWQLANECRLMLRVKGVTKGGRPMHPSQEARLARTVRRHTAQSLKAALMQAARVDRMVKGLDGGDPWLGLLQLALLMSGQAMLREAA